MSNVKTIVDYYDATVFDYKIGWRLNKSMAMHYGFWGKKTKTLGTALENEDKLLATMARIEASDTVLDAGCGVGGSAIYLAKNLRCSVLGVTLSANQVTLAQKNAERKSVSSLARFQVANFNETGLKDASFDVVWAVESVCHNLDKLDFIREAYRLLKPGGRLIIADGFAANSNMSPTEEALMRKWLAGWGVDSLDTSTQFEEALKQTGFRKVTYTDKTDAIRRSARRIYLYSFAAIPMDITMRALRIRKAPGKMSAQATRYQYVALNQRLWVYGIYTAVR